jgi:hypothetical protein
MKEEGTDAYLHEVVFILYRKTTGQVHRVCVNDLLGRVHGRKSEVGARSFTVKEGGSSVLQPLHDKSVSGGFAGEKGFAHVTFARKDLKTLPIGWESKILLGARLSQSCALRSFKFDIKEQG